MGSPGNVEQRSYPPVQFVDPVKGRRRRLPSVVLGGESRYGRRIAQEDRRVDPEGCNGPATVPRTATKRSESLRCVQQRSRRSPALSAC